MLRIKYTIDFVLRNNPAGKREILTKSPLPGVRGLDRYIVLINFFEMPSVSFLSRLVFYHT